MFGIDLFDASLLPAMLVALVAGVLSFLSPCVLPIVPPYLAYMGGISMGDIQDDARGARRKALLPAVFFVLGLSTVFIFLGFTASVISQFFLANQILLAQIAGLVIYVFGLQFFGFRRAWIAYLIFVALHAWAGFAAGTPEGFWAIIRPFPGWIILAVTLLCQFGPWDRLALFDREARLDAGDRGGSAFGAYVLGLAFAFGWTPCIGPQLGAILSIAATESSVERGTALLAVYALGLGIPFLLAAAFIDRTHRMMARLKPHMGLIEAAMGLLLIFVGTALMVGAFSAFAFWLLEAFPVLGQLG